MIPATPSPDLLLARRAAAGHREAWEEIVERYGERLYNLAIQFAGSREEAEDLTQEIFLRLYRSLRRYRGEAPLVAWTLRLSRNLCIDHYRRSRRERRGVRVAEEVLEHLAGGDDPVAAAEQRQRARAVHTALEEMPEELSETLLLRDLQGWSEAETAAYLELPVGTVKSRLHRARHALAELLAPRLEGGRQGVAPC